jgi:hypothetical protein
MTNEALRAAGLEVRVSHIPDSESLVRSDARAWLPKVAWEIERRGEHSVLGERAREQFAQRREAALERTAAAPGVVGGARKSAEEIRNQAIEEWRAMRAQLAHGGPARVAPSEVAARELDHERQAGSLRRELGRDDFGL